MFRAAPLLISTLLAALPLAGCVSRAQPDDGYVYVVPLGPVAVEDLEGAARVASELTARPARRLAPLDFPGDAVRPDGGQDVRALLDALLHAAPDDAWRIVGVTAAPLRAPGYRSVVGFARRGERAVVLSLEALPLATPPERAVHVRRVLLHELGHTHGAGHCHARCAMAAGGEEAEVTDLADRYCPEHRRLAEAALRRGLDDPETLAGRGAEQMRLARWADASDVWRRALLRSPLDPRLYTALGIALMAKGDLPGAEAAFGEAERLEPLAPQALYARAALYAAGLAPHRAGAYLEAAVARDGDAHRAHRAAGIVYQDLLGEPAAARRHFEAHVGLGGRDPDVLARLAAIASADPATYPAGAVQTNESP